MINDANFQHWEKNAYEPWHGPFQSQLVFRKTICVYRNDFLVQTAYFLNTICSLLKQNLNIFLILA